MSSNPIVPKVPRTVIAPATADVSRPQSPAAEVARPSSQDFGHRPTTQTLESPEVNNNNSPFALFNQSLNLPSDTEIQQRQYDTEQTLCIELRKAIAGGCKLTIPNYGLPFYLAPEIQTHPEIFAEGEILTQPEAARILVIPNQAFYVVTKNALSEGGLGEAYEDYIHCHQDDQRKRFAPSLQVTHDIFRALFKQRLHEEMGLSKPLFFARDKIRLYLDASLTEDISDILAGQEILCFSNQKRDNFFFITRSNFMAPFVQQAYAAHRTFFPENSDPNLYAARWDERELLDALFAWQLAESPEAIGCATELDDYFSQQLSLHSFADFWILQQIESIRTDCEQPLRIIKRSMKHLWEKECVDEDFVRETALKAAAAFEKGQKNEAVFMLQEVTATAQSPEYQNLYEAIKRLQQMLAEKIQLVSDAKEDGDIAIFLPSPQFILYALRVTYPDISFSFVYGHQQITGRQSEQLREQGLYYIHLPWLAANNEHRRTGLAGLQVFYWQLAQQAHFIAQAAHSQSDNLSK